MSTAPDPLPLPWHDPVPLGAGAFGRVYRARDAEGRAVAVKVLAPELAGDADAIWRFAAEARRLARFAHAALPAARGEGTTADGRPCYAMDLVEGGAAADGAPLPPAHVRHVLKALVGFLADLHARGYVHGDLKSDNVRVDAVGATHVLDLGLLAPVGQRRATIAGTPAYMAPEVLRQAPVAPPADMYALGVLAYAMRTGREPFTGSPAEVLHGILVGSVPAIAGVAADDELDSLIRALLAKDAGARPSAPAVAARLAGEPAPGPVVTLAAGPLVGRDDVLVAVGELLRGGRGAMALAGGPGMGKSAALDACRLAALLAGRPYLAAVGGGAPDAVVRAILRQALAVADHVPGDRLATWLAGQVPAELADLEPAARRAALNGLAAAALAEAARAVGGLAIGVDDWHLVDQTGREALAGLISRHAGDAPIAWVLAGDPATPPPAGTPTVALGPLDGAAIGTWLTGRLGGPPPDALIADLAGAAGCPLVLVGLVEHAAAHGALAFAGDAWTYTAGALAGAGAGQGLGPIWAARLASAGDAARALAFWIGVAATAGGVPPRVLAAVGAVPALDVAPALEALVAAGLVAVRGERLLPGAPGVAAIFLADRSPAAKATAADVLATALAGPVDPDDLPLGDLTTATRLALAGGDPDRALPLASAAGRRLLALPAPAEAFALLDEAMALLAERPVLDLQIARAEAARALDRVDVARADYEAARAALDAADPRVAPVGIGLGKCRQLQGDYPGAAAALAEAAAVAGATGRPDLAARATTALARVALFRGEAAAAGLAAQEAVALARTAGRPAVLAQALNLAGVLAVQQNPDDLGAAFAMLDEALGLARGLGDRLGEAFAQESLGNARLAVGDMAGAADAFAANMAAAEAAGSETERLAASLAVARVDADLGRPGAADLAALVARRAEAAGRTFVRGLARAVESAAWWRQGQPARAATALDFAIAASELLGNAYMAFYVQLYRAEAALGAGNGPAAAAALAAAGRAPSADLAERLAAATAEATRLANDPAAKAMATELLGARNRWAARAAHQTLAALALTAGNAEVARDHAQAAREIARPWGAPWHDAADHLLLAHAAAAAGDAATAIEEARAAIALGDPINPMAVDGAGELLEGLGRLAEGRAARGSARGDAPATGTLAIAPGDLDAWVQALVAERDERGLAARLLEGAVALARAERGYVLAYDAGRWRGVTTQGLDFAREVEAGFSETIAAKALYEAEPIYVVDASSDEAFREAASVVALGLRTVVALPLMAGDDVLGVLYMDRADVDPVLGPAELALLMVLARCGAGLIASARVGLGASDQAGTWRRCADLATRLMAIADADLARAAVLADLAAGLGAARACWLSPDGAGAWQVKAKFGAAAATAYSQGVVDWVAARGEPLSLVDAGSDADWGSRGSVQALGLATVWALPARGDVLYLDAVGVRGEDRLAVAAAAAVADWAAEALVARWP